MQRRRPCAHRSTTRFDFGSVLRRIYGIDDLAALELLSWENDQSTDFHATQRVPTFRVHLPGKMAVCEFHTGADFNFRCIPIADYVPSKLSKVDAKRGLWIADYFDVL